MVTAEVPPLGDILVVDDEPINIMVLKGVLSKAGYCVHSAQNGATALELSRTLRPDMILLDVMMPGESGFDTCRKLKADAATAHIPVMFITSLGELACKLEGLDMGAVDYITKPFMAQEVLARVRSHMNFNLSQRTIINAQASRLGQVRSAQMALLVKPEALPQARFAVQFLPALEAGGDFYDVVALGDGVCAYFLADVSGHDLGASFITSSLKALFRQHAVEGRTPAEILSSMNAILCDITTEEVYLTAVCLCLDRQRGTYSLASGGHPPVVGLLGGMPKCFDSPGLPLGMFESAQFAGLEGTIVKGDRFFLYTDGLAENSGHYVTSDAFRARIMESCRHNGVLPLPVAVSNMLDELTGEAQPVDDVVLLGVDA